MSIAESDLQELVSLIHRAAAQVGSEYKLAKALGIDQQTISAWKAGRRACVPADRARLAGFAREDALKELVRSTLAANAGTTRGRQLRQLLGGSLQGIGAGILGGLVLALSMICSPPAMASEPALDDV